MKPALPFICLANSFGASGAVQLEAYRWTFNGTADSNATPSCTGDQSVHTGQVLKQSLGRMISGYIQIISCRDNILASFLFYKPKNDREYILPYECQCLTCGSPVNASLAKQIPAVVTETLSHTGNKQSERIVALWQKPETRAQTCKQVMVVTHASAVG